MKARFRGGTLGLLMFTDTHCCPYATIFCWRAVGFARVSRKLKLIPKT